MAGGAAEGVPDGKADGMSEKTLLYSLSTLVQACAALVAFVGTLALLIPAIPAHADLSEADGMIGISAREVGWVVRFPEQGVQAAR